MCEFLYILSYLHLSNNRGKYKAQKIFLPPDERVNIFELFQKESRKYNDLQYIIRHPMQQYINLTSLKTSTIIFYRNHNLPVLKMVDNGKELMYGSMTHTPTTVR